MMKHQAQPYVQAKRFASGRGIRIFQTRRFPNELSLQASHLEFSLLPRDTRSGARKKLNGEAAYEIRLGEWQDTPPAIFLCVVL